MEKPKEYKYILLAVLVLLVAGFYWFELRPSNIKKQCSEVTEVIPSDYGVTKEEAERNKIAYDQCINTPIVKTGKFFSDFRYCEGRRDTVEREPKEETTEKREATDGEYNSCLRSKGIK
jgi:hypothetical protein